MHLNACSYSAIGDDVYTYYAVVDEESDVQVENKEIRRPEAKKLTEREARFYCFIFLMFLINRLVITGTIDL